MVHKGEWLCKMWNIWKNQPNLYFHPKLKALKHISLGSYLSSTLVVRASQVNCRDLANLFIVCSLYRFSFPLLHLAHLVIHTKHKKTAWWEKCHEKQPQGHDAMTQSVIVKANLWQKQGFCLGRVHALFACQTSFCLFVQLYLFT